MERATRLELAIYSLGRKYSTTELRPHYSILICLKRLRLENLLVLLSQHDTVFSSPPQELKLLRFASTLAAGH